MNRAQLLWLMVASVLGVLTCAWAVAARQLRESRTLTVSLVAANGVMALGLTLTVAPLGFPYFLSHAVPNILILWAFFALVQTADRIFDLQMSQRDLWPIMLLGVCAIVGFGLSTDTGAERALALYLSVHWILGRLGFKALQHARKTAKNPPLLLLAGTSLAVALVLLTRAVLLLTGISADSLELDADTTGSLGMAFSMLLSACLANLVFAQMLFSRTIERLASKARLDELTGLLNRRALSAALMKNWVQFDTQKVPFAVLCIDINNLRAVNKAGGYEAGDSVVAGVARQVSQQLPPGDIMGRAGGGKMVALISAHNVANAQAIALRMHASIEDMPEQNPNGLQAVTLSIGWALVNASDANAESLLARANGSLAQSKAALRKRNGLEAEESGPSAPAPSPYVHHQATIDGNLKMVAEG